MDYLPKDPAILVSSINVQRLYVHSTLDWRKEDVEIAIALI